MISLKIFNYSRENFHFKLKAAYKVAFFMTSPLLLFFILCSFTSCSLWHKPLSTHNFQTRQERLSSNDYMTSWRSAKEGFLNFESEHLVLADKETQNYINELVLQLVDRNELFFKGQEKYQVKLYVMSSDKVFYFSLPTGEIIFSTRLLNKYLDNEGFLVSILLQEYLRITFRLYQKINVIPLGYMSLKSLVPLLRLGFMERKNIHEWSYYLMKRANSYPESYLSWIQMINRNQLEFTYIYPDSAQLYREESSFKQYMIKNYGLSQSFLQKINSSKRFYVFSQKYRQI
jgi:hypothetical protein